MKKPHSVLRASKGPGQVTVGGSRQDRPAVAQKVDGYDRVPGGPWHVWFSVRVPSLLRSDICISSEPSTVGKHRVDQRWGWERGV